METEESWTTITEAPNYQVSNLGRIMNRKANRELKGGLNSEGYLLVTLRNDNKDVQRAIHRLVGIYHVPNPNNLPEINHKKGIKIDNRASELEWCTKKYNLKHAVDTGLRTQYRGGWTHK